MKYLFLLLVLTVLFSTINAANHAVAIVGGTTCIPDEADSCDAVTGSSLVTVTGGVNVDSAGACAAGAGDTTAVQVGFTLELEGFYTVGVVGYGATTGSMAALIFDAEPDLADACGSSIAATAGGWSGYWEAGDYFALFTANNQEECGEFGVSILETHYDFTGNLDTDVENVFAGDFCTLSSTSIKASLIEFTPESDGFYFGSGIARQSDDETPGVTAAFVVATADMSGNLTNRTENCMAAENYIAFDTTELGYELVGGTAYTFAFYNPLPDSETDIPTYININEVVEVVYPDCDEFNAEETWLRPDIPATSIVDECVENTGEYVFDVRHHTFDDGAKFFAVDTIGCSNPDDSRSNVDGAVVIYYGEKGTARDGDTAGVAPSDVCEDFILAGDSGDGGAAYYWFPEGATVTIVPTAYSTSASADQVFTLTTASYDIVGCIPENPYVTADDAGVSSLVAFVAFLFIALF